MDKPYFLSSNLLTEIEVPEKGVISRTLFNDEHTKIILFGFAPGHVLAAHSAPFPATIQILSGEGTLTLGDDTCQVSPGCLVHMRPQLVHSVRAATGMAMLLTLNNAARTQASIDSA